MFFVIPEAALPLRSSNDSKLKFPQSIHRAPKVWWRRLANDKGTFGWAEGADILNPEQMFLQFSKGPIRRLG